VPWVLQADTKYPAWEAIFDELSVKYGTRTVTPEDAFDMVELGQAVLVDVRPQSEFDKVSAKAEVGWEGVGGRVKWGGTGLGWSWGRRHPRASAGRLQVLEWCGVSVVSERVPVAFLLMWAAASRTPLP